MFSSPEVPLSDLDTSGLPHMPPDAVVEVPSWWNYHQMIPMSGPVLQEEVVVCFLVH